MLALHRGDLSPAVQYLRGWIDRIKTAEPCAALSTFYAVADLLDGAPNAYHRVELKPNRELKALDVHLKEVLHWGRQVAEKKGTADDISAKHGAPFSRSKLFELGQEFRRYTHGQPVAAKRSNKAPKKRRAGRAGPSERTSRRPAL